MQHLEGSGTPVLYIGRKVLNPLNAGLNPICHLLALLGTHHILHISRLRANFNIQTLIVKRANYKCPHDALLAIMQTSKFQIFN